MSVHGADDARQPLANVRFAPRNQRQTRKHPRPTPPRSRDASFEAQDRSYSGIKAPTCRTGAEGEGTKMNQVNARHEILREWRSLPKELRETDEQAAAFAMQIKDKYKFSGESADRYQTVKDWLLCYLSITRGLKRNAEGEGKMSGNEKSTDPSLSAAERKTLRSREAEEAIAEHESAQKAFHENRERLREDRLKRAAAAGPMLYPAPELPDDTPVENVRL